MKDIDYRRACFNLADKLNDKWRAKYKKSKDEYKYVFEFLPASSVYMYASGLVAQISYKTPFGLFQVVTSKIGGLLNTGCSTPDEAFKSMIDIYLEKVAEKSMFLGVDPHDYPKTLEEIMS